MYNWVQRSKGDQTDTNKTGPAGASPSVRMTASAATNLMITREPAFRMLSASLYSCNVVNIYGGKSDEGSQQN
jgi:hypothetical protein